MNKYQAAVEAFHEATNMPVGLVPALGDCELRAKLIMEEAVETVAAMGFHAYAELNAPSCSPRVTLATFDKMYNEPDFEEVIDGFCDLLYVVFGSAVTMGLDLDPFFAEVHRANMDKTTGPKREDGKQLKPEGWQGPDHGPILEKQLSRAQAWKDAIEATENAAEARHERLLHGEPAAA